jgi:anti-anti-sigma regulatory factor
VIKFEVDEPKSLFVIRYRGVVRAEETKKGLEEIRDGLAKLQSGFRLLADLSELESMDVACAPFIEQSMDIFNEKGASMVVRVIPDPHRDIGMQIMSIFHYRGDVQILTCETLAQADDLLRAES